MDTATKQEVPTATEKVRVVGILARTGTRAQKRFVAAGHATKRGVWTLGRGIKNQITLPYSALKMTVAGATILMLIVGAFLLAFYVTLAALIAWESIVLAVCAALVATVLYQLMVVQPIALLIRQYAENAAMHNMGMGARIQTPFRGGAFPDLGVNFG